MTDKIIVKYKGNDYELTEVTVDADASCDGCAFESDEVGCGAMPADCMFAPSVDKAYIYIKAE